MYVIFYIIYFAIYVLVARDFYTNGRPVVALAKSFVLGFFLFAISTFFNLFNGRMRAIF